MIDTLQERICPLETGLGKTLNETYYSELKDAVDHITAQGGYVILDAHNYMRYNDPSMQPSSGSVIGNTSDTKAASTEDFAAFWAELSTRLKYNPNVIYGVMNEPHDMPTALVLHNNQAAINAIRGVGAQQLILVPGNGFTGAQRWLDESCKGCESNADVMMAITDPMDNFAFDMHLYFDNDTSGTHEECTTSAPTSLLPVTMWLQENNFTAFLTELGAGSNPTCFDTLNNTITHLEDSGVFVGWTYWSAGPLWGEYFMSIEPEEGPQANSTWPEVLEPHIKSYSPMMKCGVSTSGRNGVSEEMKSVDGCLGVRLPA
jgi:endoglucanase